MIKSAPAIPWSPGEAATVNEFLNTPVGTKWLQVLFSMKPIPNMASTEQMALTGAYAAGYEVFFSAIKITRTPQKPEPDPSTPGIDPTKD